MRRSTVWGALVGVTALLVSACGGGLPSAGDSSARRAASSSSHRATSKLRQYDPPLRFRSSGRKLPGAEAGSVGDAMSQETRRLAVTLRKTTAFVAKPGALLAVNARTGGVIGRVDTEEESVLDEAPENEKVRPPRVITMNGKTVVLAAFVVNVTGAGTQQDHKAVELLAMDARSHKLAWRSRFVIPDKYSSASTATLGKITEDTAAIQVSELRKSIILGVDLKSRKIAWKRGDVWLVGTSDEVAVVRDNLPDQSSHNIEGLRLRDGTRRWKESNSEHDVSATSAGSRLLLTSGLREEKDSFAVRDMRTGKIKPEATKEPVPKKSCYDDHKGVVVCVATGARGDRDNKVAALDSRTGKKLWSLPDESAGRVAPDVTAAWHGAVYGTTDKGTDPNKGTVVLDARTGKDKERNPGAAPYVVNSYYGVVYDKFQEDRVRLRRAMK